MSDTTPSVARALIDESKRQLLEESWPRIQKAVANLSDDDVWHRENAHTNSVGNLLLHLSGNVRQWIVSGLGGAPDERQRDREFSEKGPTPRSALLEMLEETLGEAGRTLDALDPQTLLEPREIQGTHVNGLRALVHVVEHFSYHVGQITHIVKARKDIDLGYYEGQDLNRRNEP